MLDALARAVPLDQLHTHDVGGIHIMKEHLKEKYAATYHFGKTVVHVVAPDITEEENERRIHEFHMAAWPIIDELIEKGEKV